MHWWFDVFVIGSLIALVAALTGLLLWELVEWLIWKAKGYKGALIASAFGTLAILALSGAVGYVACVLLVVCVLEGWLLLRPSTR